MLSTQYIYGWSLKPEQILYLLQFKIDFVGCQLPTFLMNCMLLTWLCGGGFLQTWGIFNLKVMLTTQSFLSLLIDNPSKLREIDWIDFFFKGKSTYWHICSLYLFLLDLAAGLPTLEILFLSNHNIHKSSSDLCFWASDNLIGRF